MIKVEHLSFSYNEPLFNDINFNIKKNKITLIIGKNGSGKSTLSYLLSGLLFTNKGTITIDNLIISKKTKNQEIRNKIGIIFQNPNNQILFTDTYEDIKFTLENMHTPKDQIDSIIQESLKKVNLHNLIHSNPYNLSGGQKQRLAVASAIATHPNYLIFDEATSMLDSKGKEDIYKLFNSLKKEMGIIFITNNINEIVYADELIIIDNKQIFQYNIRDIISNPSLLTNHQIEIPFLLKLTSILNINDIKNINEKNILEILKKELHHD